MNKRYYALLIASLILAGSLYLVIARGLPDYEYDIVELSDGENTTRVISQEFGTEWNIESKLWFDECKAGKNSISFLECDDANYESFIDRRVKEIIEGTRENNIILNTDYKTILTTMQEDINRLNTENEMLKTELCKKDISYVWCSGGVDG